MIGIASEMSILIAARHPALPAEMLRVRVPRLVMRSPAFLTNLLDEVVVEYGRRLPGIFQEGRTWSAEPERGPDEGVGVLVAELLSEREPGGRPFGEP